MTDTERVINAALANAVVRRGSTVTITVTINLDNALTGDNLATATSILVELVNARTEDVVLASQAMTNVNNTTKKADLAMTAAQTLALPEEAVEGSITITLADGTTIRKQKWFRFHVEG